MNNMNLKTIYAIAVMGMFGIMLSSCDNETLVPKPPTYLRLELPESSYEMYDDSCGYSYQLSSLYQLDTANTPSGGSCTRKIDLGPLNGSMFVYYWDMEQPLSYYVNNANDEVGNHKLKATFIGDERIIRPENRVFGTCFELQGDVATPFQFYLTDSTDRFLYAEVLFNTTPNYDSLKPTLDYLKKDIDTLLQTFKWN